VGASLLRRIARSTPARAQHPTTTAHASKHTTRTPTNTQQQKASKGVVLPLDTALAMWQLLFADERRWQYIDDWCAFLQEHHNRAVSKDTWVQLFDFARVS
jgi:hypothetical protein